MGVAAVKVTVASDSSSGSPTISNDSINLYGSGCGNNHTNNGARCIHCRNRCFTSSNNDYWYFHCNYSNDNGRRDQ